MKKRNLVLIILAVSGYLITTGYRTGAAHNGWDCTGAETGLGNPSGCASGTGCHSTSATSTVAVSIELDSAGYPTMNYIGGMTYSVKISAVNNSTSTFPKFGFQLGCIQGYSSMVTPTPEGFWIMPLPASTRLNAPSAGNYVVSVVEHTMQLSPTTGSGGNGSTFVESFLWTAPAAGTGTVSMWGAVNLVNNNGNADNGDKWNTTHIVIGEEIINDIENVNNENHFSIDVVNPVSNHILYLKLNNAKSAQLLGDLYSVNGQFIQHIYDENGSTGNIETAIHLGDEINSGLYILHFQSGNEVQNKKVVVF